MDYDGHLISELGAKRYLRGKKAQLFSNINPLQRTAVLNKKWEECDFGCHTPSYRVLKHELGYQEYLSQLDMLSPLVAGFVDGVKREVKDRPERLSQGIQRTMEGLGASGKDVFAQVGAEDAAVYNFVTVNVSQLLNVELTLLENPLTQLLFIIIYEYISLLPDEILESMVRDGAIISPDSVDTNFVLAAVRYGLSETVTSAHIEQAKKLVFSKGQRYIGKQMGSKVTRALSVIIAVKITKKILTTSTFSRSIKKKIFSLRKSAKKTKGGLVGVLIALLKANGWLGVAAADSRRLQNECPILWRYLRYQLGGFDMMVFLIRGFVAEYIDRISVLEKSPEVFFEMMAALVREGKTREVFFPK